MKTDRRQREDWEHWFLWVVLDQITSQPQSHTAAMLAKILLSDHRLDVMSGCLKADVEEQTVLRPGIRSKGQIGDIIGQYRKSRPRTRRTRYAHFARGTPGNHTCSCTPVHHTETPSETSKHPSISSQSQQLTVSSLQVLLHLESGSESVPGPWLVSDTSTTQV